MDSSTIIFILLIVFVVGFVFLVSRADNKIEEEPIPHSKFSPRDDTIDLDSLIIPTEAEESNSMCAVKEVEPPKLTPLQLLRLEALRLNDSGEQLLKDALDEWEAIKTNLPNYKPEVSVKKYASGKFLCYEEHELPINFIEAIDVSIPDFTRKRPRIGEDGSLVDYSKPRWYPAHVYEPYISEWSLHEDPKILGGYVIWPSKSTITVTMSSGRKISIKCNTLHIEILLDAFNQAWKNGKTINGQTA